MGFLIISFHEHSHSFVLFYIQPLTSLKKMVLVSCLCLKELPDLANATNLEILDVCGCQSLVEIHSSVGNLHRLQSLDMIFCKKQKVFQTSSN